ncbi:MAG: hypothetical protein HY866_19420 [Chloroflexi bacterium]|nr:hypothetical protein [Chloroflexota bacterium]
MNNDKLMVLLQNHLARYPHSEIMDVYKLLHQATFGPGHLIANKKAAREWLDQEISLLVASDQEPLFENIHPDGAMVRAHLRPYLTQNGKIGLLLDAFTRSAEQVKVNTDIFQQRWQVFEAACQSKQAWTQKFNLRELALFGRMRCQEGWPAVHHSPAYETAYHPHYRVLTRSEAEELCKKLKVEFEVV